MTVKFSFVRKKKKTNHCMHRHLTWWLWKPVQLEGHHSLLDHILIPLDLNVSWRCLMHENVQRFTGIKMWPIKVAIHIALPLGFHCLFVCLFHIYLELVTQQTCVVSSKRTYLGERERECIEVICSIHEGITFKYVKRIVWPSLLKLLYLAFEKHTSTNHSVVYLVN